MKKRNKLLKRKWYLARRDKKLCIDTLREMEEMVKHRLFTEEQLKCKYKRKCEFLHGSQGDQFFFFLFTVPLFRKQYANMKDELNSGDASASGAAQTDVPAKLEFQNKKTTE